MSTTVTPGSGPPDRPKAVKRPGDRIFSGLATGSGLLILLVLAGVAVFLFIEALPAFTAAAEDLPGGEGFLSFVAPLAFGTVLAAIIAVVLAVPFSVAIALYLTFYAPRRLARLMSNLVDLLAAVPSIVYGLWGAIVLAVAMTPVLEWLFDNLGFLPFFEGPPSSTGRTMLVVGIVLAVMITPIITALTREVFSQTPQRLRESALALGATRWEMIRMTAFPFARSAIISSTMLGLGRALGETMAVTIILSASGGVTFNLIGQSNPGTIAANIALDFPEQSGLAINALIASGLVLFGITLVVNMAARAIIARNDRMGRI